MIQRRKKYYEVISIQMTPMIDMTFLLLIFFMLTAKITTEQRHQSITLPIASAAKLPPEKDERDIINIDASGQIYIGDQLYSHTALQTYLKHRLNLDANIKIYVRADEITPSIKVREFMKIATEVGVTKVIFATQSRAD